MALLNQKIDTGIRLKSLAPPLAIAIDRICAAASAWASPMLSRAWKEQGFFRKRLAAISRHICFANRMATVTVLDKEQGRQCIPQKQPAASNERAASQFSQVHHMQEGRKCSGVARDWEVRNHGVCRRRVVWPSVPRALDRASARQPRNRHHQAHSRRLPSDPQLSSSRCV